MNTIQSIYQQLIERTSLSNTRSSSAEKATTTGSTDVFGPAYILDLSDEARTYLETGQMPVTGVEEPGTSELTEEEMETVQSILDKYKDREMTDETRALIDEELTEAGIDPEKLKKQPPPPPPGAPSSFEELTDEQEEQLTSILEKYKGQEITQDLLIQIQTELQDAGLLSNETELE